MPTPHRAILLTLNWNVGGGIERVARETAAALQSLGWSVAVWSVFDARPAHCGPLVSRPLAPATRLQRWLYARTSCWRRAARQILSDGADLLLLGHPLMTPLLHHLGHRGPRTWLWTYGIDAWGEPGRRALGPISGGLDRVIAVSRFTAEQVARLRPDLPIDVLHPCIDTAFFTPAADPAAVRRDEILICGRLAADERYKGHETLFRALPRARARSGRPLRLRVVGDGDDRPRLQALAHTLRLGDAVEFAGRLDAAGLREAYRRAAVFAMPSAVIQRPRGGWGGEGLGLVYLEAAACGRPVIASREGGAPETVRAGQTGLLVDPQAVDQVADAIVQVTGDAAAADRLGAAGRDWVVAEFSRARYVQRVAALLQANRTAG